jgi:hypothetical protein
MSSRCPYRPYRHALAILPGLTHYNIVDSPLLAATALAFIDQ